jgi:hypothetical protein
MPSGRWIRPVSARPAGEISEEERRYEDGTSAQVLDVIDIPIVGPPFARHQTENYLIDPDVVLDEGRQSCRYPASSSFWTTRSTLWKNGDSSLNGRNDRVRIDAGTEHAGSLYLIAPEFPDDSRRERRRRCHHAQAPGQSLFFLPRNAV